MIVYIDNTDAVTKIMEFWLQGNQQIFVLAKGAIDPDKTLAEKI